jgi:hypothetical protein
MTAKSLKNTGLWADFWPFSRLTWGYQPLYSGALFPGM